MATSKETAGQWDDVNSTYWWRMETPAQDRPFFKGYSKKYGHNEALDKEYLLLKKVSMLEENGWLDKSEKIEIHKREEERCKAKDGIILTLFPDNFILGDELITNKNVYYHLKSMYERRAGKENKNYYGPRPEKINKPADDRVNIAIGKQYTNLDQVYKEIHRLSDDGIAQGQLADAFRKIIEKNPKLK